MFINQRRICKRHSACRVDPYLVKYLGFWGYIWFFLNGHLKLSEFWRSGLKTSKNIDKNNMLDFGGKMHDIHIFEARNITASNI